MRVIYNRGGKTKYITRKLVYKCEYINVYVILCVCV